MTDVSTTSTRLRALRSVLACPRCAGPVVDRDSVALDGVIADATLWCDQHEQIGVVRGYRPSFHLDDFGDGWMPAGTSLRPVELGAISIEGSWGLVGEGLMGEGEGATARGLTGRGGLVIEFLTHSWSGTVSITDGNGVQEVDLCTERFGTERVTLDARRAGEVWTLVLQAKPDDPDRNQVVIRRVWEVVPVADLPLEPFAPSNAGNPYPPRFERLLESLAEDAVVVDVGGGDRRHPDPRVLNFEYMKFDRPDFFGSGLELPIRSGSVDLVLSQAVLEHVPDPQRGVDEIRRILRPGGLVYAEIAFMQPLHAVPFHFFNVTPHGLDLLFDAFDVVDSGSAGGLEDTLRWIFRLVDAEAALGTPEVDHILASLARLDRTLSPEALDHIASFVFVEAAAPLR